VKRAGGQFVTPKSVEALAEFDAQTAGHVESEVQPAAQSAPVSSAPVSPAPVTADYAHQSFLRA
jgi:type III secretion protein HrpB1